MRVTLLAVALIIQSAWYPQATQGKECPIKVQISIDEASLKSDLSKPEHIFYVDARVTNVSDSDRSILLWFDDEIWKSDVSEVGPWVQTRTATPPPVWTTLKPREERKTHIKMVAASLKKLPVTFRLGFLPGWDEGHNTDLPRNAPIWSNPVTLTSAVGASHRDRSDCASEPGLKTATAAASQMP